MRIDNWYEALTKMPSVINEHLWILSKLASACETVTEFGVQCGNSTIAFIHGRPKRVNSYDINPCPNFQAISEAADEAQVEWRFFQKDDLTVELEATDLLFIDSHHTGDHLAAELNRHSEKVRKYIVLHDTVNCGLVGEGGGPGLWPAVEKFLKENKNWIIAEHLENNNGLTILVRG